MIHQLKLVGRDLANAVLVGDKTYEIRVADRDYHVGDLLYQTLYDKYTGEYVKHDVSGNFYAITFISNIVTESGPYEVLGIRKACRSMYAIRELISKLYSQNKTCTIVCYGIEYRNAILTSVGNDTVTVNINGVVTSISYDNIVWAVPDNDFSISNRSIPYINVDMDRLYNSSDFHSYHVYMLYEMRLKSEYGDKFK